MPELENEERLGRSESEDQIVELLQDPETKAGLAMVRVAVAEHFAERAQPGQEASVAAAEQRLQNAAPEFVEGFEREFAQIRDRNPVHVLAEGVTEDGICVVAVSYGGKYEAFTFDLRDVARMGFADTLESGRTQYVNAHHEMEIETAADPMLVSRQEYRDALKNRRTDGAESETKEATYRAWHERNTLRFGHHDADHQEPPRYGGKVVRSFEEAALGTLGRARVEEAVAPLQAKQAAEDQEWNRALSAGGMHSNREAVEVHRAASNEMAERARQTIAIMHANPEAVRGNPDLVHDPIKAEHMAYEAKGSMDKAAKAKNEAAQERHEAEAGRKMEAAAQEYKADPLEATKKRAKKGLLGWLKRD